MSEENKPAAKAKPVRLVNGKDGAVTSISIGGEQYDADDKGVFTVAAEHAAEAAQLAGLVAAPAAK